MSKQEISPRWKTLCYDLNVGLLASRTSEIQRILAENPHNHNFPFKKIVKANLGNPLVFIKPLTWVEEVHAAANLTHVLEDNDKARKLFSQEVIDEAKKINKLLGFHPGCYTDPQGPAGVREAVADYIGRRDGTAPANPDEILLSIGATSHLMNTIACLIAKDTDGVMIPCPEYPMYSSAIGLGGGRVVQYWPDEEHEWAISMKHLEEIYAKATSEGTDVKVLVIVNPGNPLGNIVPYEQQKEIIDFCLEKDIVLIADEVYQKNIWNGEWFSFRKVATDMNVLDRLKIVSCHSTSKGMFGECGRRGGWVELINIDPEVSELLITFNGITELTTDGVMFVYLMAEEGPKMGGEERERYDREYNSILADMKKKAELLREFLVSLEGVSCVKPAGAMYLFPSIDMPQKAIEKAAELGVPADELYCTQLLESCGLQCVPGSAFGQKEGTYHFRMTILPSFEDLENLLPLWKEMHANFMKEYK